MRILILEDSIRTLSFSYTLLNSRQFFEIHMVTPLPEAGLSNSLAPGAARNVHTMVKELIRHMPEANLDNPFLRNSWIHRALAIECVAMGLNLHLRSSANENMDQTYEFEGTAANVLGTKERFDSIVLPTDIERGNLWHGFVSVEQIDRGSIDRGDGTFETWRATPQEKIEVLQEGTWRGQNPFEAVRIAIEEGVREATQLLSSLK